MKEKSNPFSFPILTLLFFAWGFITCLNDILIPYFKATFSLSYFQSSLVQFAFFGAYFLGSVSYYLISKKTGDPINRMGYKNGILLGLFISAIGTTMFYPAADLASFPLFLMALMVLALGFTLLQIASNPFVAVIGPEESAAQRLNLAQAMNSLGTTLAPILGGALILTQLNMSLENVKQPYLIFSLGFLLLMVIIKFTRLPVFINKEKNISGNVLSYPQLKYGVFAIFFYVGSEVSVGSFLTAFAELPDITGLPSKEATLFVSLYWGSLMIGRFTGSALLFSTNKLSEVSLTLLLPFATFALLLFVFYLKGFEVKSLLPYSGWILISSIISLLAGKSNAKTLIYFSLSSFLFLIVGCLSSGKFALFTIVAVGLFNSVMWPVIFTTAIRGLGDLTSTGSSLLVMAILGGALIPPIQGLVADGIDVKISFLVPALGFLYLAWYGYKIKNIFVEA
jgi:FHS family L-fucose permease-like MFS transporter